MQRAWLGEGYYFWYYETDAKTWGYKSKRSTGEYEVYEAMLDTENAHIIDTVFDKEQYEAWVELIETCCRSLSKAGDRVSLLELNQFIESQGINEKVGIDGYLFQDISSNNSEFAVNTLHYRKRIQLVLYNLAPVQSFKFLYSGKSR